MSRGIVKIVISYFFVMVLLFGGISQNAQAQQKTKALNFNTGFVMSTYLDDAFFTLGLGFDSQFGKHFMISPEVQLWTENFRFNRIPFLPGLILNFRLKNFFFGTGLVFPFTISKRGGITSGQLAVKINSGLRTNRIKLTIYLITIFLNLFEENLLGASIGIVF